MFSIPSPANLMMIFIAPILIACAIVNWQENIWTVATFWAVLIADLLLETCDLPARYKQWERDRDTQPTREKIIDDRPTQADPNLIPRLGYGQSTVRLKIDCVAKFNQIILTQIDGGLDVDMTENYWVKRNNGAELSEWVRIGGTGPTEWRDMIERGIACHAYKRVGGQNKCVPDERAIIRSLAKGYPLPPLPR